jgi:hypothetical protein
MTDQKQDLLRHTLATIAYRGGKAVRNAPPEFASFKPAASSRTPLEILSHIGDLFEWARTAVEGNMKWETAEPRDWDGAVSRFFDTLGRLDAALASAPMQAPAEKIFQGPIADALTHVGQLTMLRRMAGAPIRGENYYVAVIAVGKVGVEQAAPRREFD